MFACFWNELSFQPSSKRGSERGLLPKLQGHLSLQQILLETLRLLLSVGARESPPHLVPTDSYLQLSEQ